MEPFTVFIKDRAVTIRPIVDEDASAWLDYLKQVGDETDFLAFSSEQITMDTDQARQYLEQASNRTDSLFLLATDDNRILATLNFECGRWPFFRHHGEFGISVVEEFWGCGLARIMMGTMLEWATQNNVRKIHLKVRTDNHRAIHLYQSMGFSIEGMAERQCFRPGVYYLAYHMGLKL